MIFLYGDSLFGTEDISGYGAPATGYGGKYLSDFWSTANILSQLLRLHMELQPLLTEHQSRHTQVRCQCDCESL